MNIQPILDFIDKKKDNSNFFQSLADQYASRGFLTQKQKDRVIEAMEKEEDYEKKKEIREQKAKEQEKSFEEELSYTIKPHDILEIKTWLAKSFQEKLGMETFFRNLEVVSVHNETSKAYEVKVKFSSQILTACHICGLQLSNDVSKATGVGPTCAKKIGLSRPTVADAARTIAELEAFVSNVGVIGPIWIPRSQIKSITRKERTSN